MTTGDEESENVVDNLFRDVDDQFKDLERDYNQAREDLATADVERREAAADPLVASNERFELQSQVAALHAEVSRQGDELDERDRLLGQLGDKIAGFEADIERRDDMLQELHQAKQDVQDERREQARLTSLLDARAAERHELAEVAQRLQNERDHVQELLTTSLARHEEAEAARAEIDDKFRHVEAARGTAAQEHDARAHELIDARAEVSRVTDKLEELGRTAAANDQRAEKAEALAERRASEASYLNRRIDALNTKLAESDSRDDEAATLRQDLNMRERRISELERQLATSEARANAANAAVDALADRTADYDQLVAQVAELTHQRDAAWEEASGAREEAEQPASTEVASLAVQARELSERRTHEAEAAAHAAELAAAEAVAAQARAAAQEPMPVVAPPAASERESQPALEDLDDSDLQIIESDLASLAVAPPPGFVAEPFIELVPAPADHVVPEVAADEVLVDELTPVSDDMLDAPIVDALGLGDAAGDAVLINEFGAGDAARIDALGTDRVDASLAAEVSVDAATIDNAGVEAAEDIAVGDDAASDDVILGPGTGGAVTADTGDVTSDGDAVVDGAVGASAHAQPADDVAAGSPASGEPVLDPVIVGAWSSPAFVGDVTHGDVAGERASTDDSSGLHEAAADAEAAVSVTDDDGLSFAQDPADDSTTRAASSEPAADAATGAWPMNPTMEIGVVPEPSPPELIAAPDVEVSPARASEAPDPSATPATTVPPAPFQTGLTANPEADEAEPLAPVAEFPDRPALPWPADDAELQASPPEADEAEPLAPVAEFPDPPALPWPADDTELQAAPPPAPPPVPTATTEPPAIPQHPAAPEPVVTALGDLPASEEDLTAGAAHPPETLDVAPPALMPEAISSRRRTILPADLVPNTPEAVAYLLNQPGVTAIVDARSTCGRTAIRPSDLFERIATLRDHFDVPVEVVVTPVSTPVGGAPDLPAIGVHHVTGADTVADRIRALCMGFPADQPLVVIAGDDHVRRAAIGEEANVIEPSAALDV